MGLGAPEPALRETCGALAGGGGTSAVDHLDHEGGKECIAGAYGIRCVDRNGGDVVRLAGLVQQYAASTLRLQDERPTQSGARFRGQEHYFFTRRLDDVRPSQEVGEIKLA